jgi:hypothetical protein
MADRNPDQHRGKGQKDADGASHGSGVGVNSAGIKQGTYPLADHSEGMHGYSATAVAPRNRVNT